jgi:hypothetical protein
VRRLGCALAAFGALALPAPASAHTLPMARAVAKARQYAADLAVRTWETRNRGSELTGCRRVNDHTVECTFFTSAQPEPPLTGTFRCDEVVQVYYTNPRSSVPQARPVGLPNCHLV